MRKVIALIWGFCVLATVANAQNPEEQGYPLINNYSPKVYGADTQNWAILQDDRGIMYFGNNLGLLEFDGADWRLYPLPNNTTVRSLANGENGKIYAGGVGDFGYFSPDSAGELLFHSLLPFVPHEYRDFSDVWQVFTKGAQVYFNVSKYILIWDPEKQEIKALQGDDSFHLIFLVNGTLFAREWGKGLLVLNGDTLELVKGGERFANERIYVILPFPDEKGVYLIVTRTMGLFKYDGTNFIPFKTKVDEFIKQNLIYAPGAILYDGNILLGTLNDGAVVIDRYGRELRRYNRDSGIISTVVYFQFQDKSGAIWLPTDNGISRIDYASQVSYFDSRNNFSTTAYQIIRHKGTIYAATNNGVYYLDPVTTNFVQLEKVNFQAFSFLESGDDLLAGTMQGLIKVDKDDVTVVRESISNEYNVNTLKKSLTYPGRLFIGATGLWSIRREKNKWIDEGQILDIVDVVNSIEEEKDGTLWIGTNSSGIFKIKVQTDANGTILRDKTTIENFDNKNDLPIGGLYVLTLNGEHYFLSATNFYRFNEKDTTFYLDNTYKVVSSLANYASPTNIKQDNLNRMWISLGREPALGTPLPNGRYEWQTAPFRRFANEIIVSIFPEENGIVWFSSSSSIIRYDLTKNNAYNSDYRALVRRVEIGADSTIYYGGKLARQAIPKFEFSNNSIKFTFAVPSFEDETANQYKTFLEGFENDWSGWVKANQKEYTNLSPGRYTFHVIAKNVFEIESEEATYSFIVLPPWYRTWAAYLIFGLLLGGIIFIIDRAQRRRLFLKAQARLHMQEAEHRAEAAELQAKAAEAQALVVQAENERKTKELEEARQLQLSMLPKEIPQLAHLDIAVYMNPATEVGGDYYDFNLSSDGVLTVAVGDATGHGLNAGMMVTAAKSLFETLASEPDTVNIMNQSNHVIRQMNFATLKMAICYLKIRGNKLCASGAGMPPLLVYRGSTNDLEEIIFKGMPLGSLTSFPYEEKQVDLFPGDKIILMSDGFPERLNPKNEMLDYPRAYQAILAAAISSPKEMVQHLVKRGEEWADGRPQDDDVTFVVMEIK